MWQQWWWWKCSWLLLPAEKATVAAVSTENNGGGGGDDKREDPGIDSTFLYKHWGGHYTRIKKSMIMNKNQFATKPGEGGGI